MIDKRRTGKNVAKAMNVVGSVQGKRCIIVDDIIDTAGTLIEACMALKEEGATDIMVCNVFFRAVERIKDCEALTSVIVTDTIPLSEEAKQLDKIVVLSASNLLAKAIYRTFNNDSVSSLFS